MAEAAIMVRRLVKDFQTRHGTVRALDGIDLQVERGKTFGLIGPDGAGKTTAVRVILGLLRRTAGESTILGFDSMRDTFAIRERVGYIAQQFALPPDLSVMENMRFFAAINGLDRRERERRIPQLLAFAGLRDFTGRPAGRLSGGMRKKLALACSLVHEPQVMLLDEPTLGVDPLSRREFWNLLGELRATKGMTILVCTPYMDEAERCNRVALIYRGRIIACDTPQALKRLVPGQLLQIAPSDLQAAKKVAGEIPGVLEVQTHGLLLNLFVDDAARRGPSIAAALHDEGIACHSMRRAESRMEEAFISLVRRRRATSSHAAQGGGP